MHKINLEKYQLRTDMLVDVMDKLDDSTYQKYRRKNIVISKMKLEKKNIFNKKEGNYITLEFNDITASDMKKNVEKVLKQELSKLLEIVNYNIKHKVMIVGLGNSKSTPDSLGPLVTDKIIVTNHLYNLDIDVDKNLSKTIAFSPGVTSSTGIETCDYILGIVKTEKPDILILIDSLASSSVSRLNKSIQLTDSGISPGSGIGNKRKEISKDTIGIPVIIVGVPTVVDASVIAYDTLKYMIKDADIKLNNYFNKLLSSNVNLMVTPKEIDFVIEKLSDVISYAINHSIHKI